ncbi:Keratin-associated protein 25-1, partial [Frankliniella fusca]
ESSSRGAEAPVPSRRHGLGGKVARPRTSSPACLCCAIGLHPRRVPIPHPHQTCALRVVFGNALQGKTEEKKMKGALSGHSRKTLIQQQDCCRSIDMLLLTPQGRLVLGRSVPYNCKTPEFVSLNCKTPEFVSLNCKTPEFVSLNRRTVLQFKLTNSGVLQFKLTNSGVLQFKLTNSGVLQLFGKTKQATGTTPRYGSGQPIVP